MDHKFTEQIRLWLETPETERDYTVGALYLLKLSGNQIMYKNIISQITSQNLTRGNRHASAFISTDKAIIPRI